MDKKNFKGIVLYIFVMCILFIAFFIIGVNQYNRRISYDNQINELNEQIAAAEKHKEELKAQSEYKESDEYIEKIAREQLGMVKANEIVFIDQNKK